MELPLMMRQAQIFSDHPSGRCTNTFFETLLMTRLLRVACFAILVSVLQQPVHAEDWPQWMGPNRDGTWTETGILTRFPEGGPKKLWSKPIAGGFSGPAVSHGSVVVMDYHHKYSAVVNDPIKRNSLVGDERVLCFDSKTGKELWKFSYPCKYEISYASGPRCTATIDADQIYTLGAMGNLHCLSAQKGEVIWQKYFPKDYDAPVPIWGFCGHPLVYKNLLICLVGGKGSVAVAFDKTTGKEIWKQLSAKEQGYCPPTLIHSGGVDQLLIWHSTALNSLDPLTGEKHWSVDLKPSYGMAIAAPQKHNQHLYAGGIGWQSVMLKLDAKKPGVSEIWRGQKDTSIYPSNATPLFHDGTLYGCDCMSGHFKAVDLDSGKRLWETAAPTRGLGKSDGQKHGTAFAVRNAEHFYLLSETGELIIAKLTREKYTELARSKLIEPTGEAFGRKVAWSHPAFADQCIFVRNDVEIACFSLAKE